VKSEGRTNYKLAQLCAEVSEVATLALGSSSDSRLQQLIVHSVKATKDGSTLVVHVVPTAIADFAELEQLMAALERARTWLRQQVASEINRKHTPEITFQIVLNPESADTLR